MMKNTLRAASSQIAPATGTANTSGRNQKRISDDPALQARPAVAIAAAKRNERRQQPKGRRLAEHARMGSTDYGRRGHTIGFRARTCGR